MGFDFSRFDEKVDMEGLQKDIADAAASNNNNSFREVPAGKYEVKVELMELGVTGPNSATPDMPMVKIWFKIVEGDYKNSMIFYNKKIMGTRNDGLMIHQMNSFLRSLKSGLLIEFSSYSQYAKLLLDVHEAIDDKFEYLLEYGEQKNGFKTYEIKDVYELD